MTATPVQPQRVEFVRAISRLDATALVVGSMIGSGIYIVSADILRQVHSPGVLLFVWVLSGRLTLTDGPAEHALAAGDTFELGEPRPREFRNDGPGDCRYLVVVTRMTAP